MRPAHCAREVSTLPIVRQPSVVSFNEARALCAGSSTAQGAAAPSSGCFNEARALCAGS